MLYWLASSQNSRKIVLLISSFIFYAAWFPPHLMLLLVLVTTCWLAALYSIKYKRFSVILASLILLGSLGYWKYASFFVQVLSDLGLDESWMSSFAEPLALPLGISFIVFQGLGYVIDVSKREKTPEMRWDTETLFIVFFPQLIAGPICRAHELMPQLREKQIFNHGEFSSGFAIVAIGLFLKVVFADNISPFVDNYYETAPDLTASQAWFATLGFSVQILADFWGYSTMAYGMALMFGIVLPVNFRLPYLATSIREFWRRWHITLSQWLRDYLYKPLGGSKKGYARTSVALLLTMLIGGLWHGAAYTFIVWGLLHGLALMLEHGVKNALGPVQESYVDKKVISNICSIISWFYAMSVVLIGWVIFRATDLNEAFILLEKMVSGLPNLTDVPTILMVLVVGFFVTHIFIESLIERLRGKTISNTVCYLLAAWLMLVSILMSAEIPRPFIYFQF